MIRELTTHRSTFRVRRGSSQQWRDANPTLASGELGLEIDTGMIKGGNGLRPWNELPYVGGGEGVVGGIVPVGGQYTMFAEVETGAIDDMYPPDRLPEALWPGTTWELVFENYVSEEVMGGLVPIGGQYTMFAEVETGTIDDMYPHDSLPEALWPGTTWELIFEN